MTSLQRLHDWPLRLEAFVQQRANQPFAWGVQDCALFAADAVQAITGADVAPPALRQHRSARAALRSLQAHGGLHGVAQAALGTPIAPGLATVGDVLLLSSNNLAFVQRGRPMLALCNGGTALAPGLRGLISVGLQRATHAWRVG
jgi:hypothetical protein